MPETDLILYQPEDGLPAVQVVLRDGDVWLDRLRMSELFQRDRSVIQRHIDDIYRSGELDADRTCAKNAQVRFEGGREVERLQIVPPGETKMVITPPPCHGQIEFVTPAAL